MLVTTTFSPSLSDMRAQLAIKTCLAARDRGYEIIVVDGSPCQEFKSELCRTGATVIDQIKPGMGASRREALKAGLETNAHVVIWIEPEKYPLVPLLDKCIDPVMGREADIVIPKRKTFVNYPAYQAESEAKANAEINLIMKRLDLDTFIGPRVMSRAAARLMSNYDGRVGGVQVYGDKWEILFIPLLWFLNADMLVESVPVEYVHPIEQLVEDDEAMRRKRDEQRESLVSAMRREAERLGL